MDVWCGRCERFFATPDNEMRALPLCDKCSKKYFKKEKKQKKKLKKTRLKLKELKRILNESY